MKKKKKLLIVLIAFFTACAIAAGTVLLIKFWPDKPDFEKYKRPTTSTTEELVENPIDFAALKAVNPDVFGYIEVDGTAVDYPLTTPSEGMKDDFYLDHDWQKKSKSAGSIFMQPINKADFSDPCTILYGHNMLNGSMFGTLKRFRNADFFKQNREIHIYQPGRILTYEIFSAYIFDDRHILYSYNFNNTDDYNSFLNECLNPKSLTRNVIKENLPSSNDKIVVLSTCTSVDTERYLVCGRLKNEVKTK